MWYHLQEFKHERQAAEQKASANEKKNEADHFRNCANEVNTANENEAATSSDVSKVSNVPVASNKERGKIKRGDLRKGRELQKIDLKKMLEQGYRYGARNQLATSEAQRCESLIKAAIDREWSKESFVWNTGLRPIEVDLKLGAGGVVRSFTIKSGSGDASVDSTALKALNRLKEKDGIPGISNSFIEQFPTLAIIMEPTGPQ